MKVLTGYLILLLSFYIIGAAKLALNTAKRNLKTTNTTSTSNSTIVSNKNKNSRNTQNGLISINTIDNPLSVNHKSNVEAPPIRSTETVIATRKSSSKKYIPRETKSIIHNGPTKMTISKPKLSQNDDNLVCPKENEAEFKLFAPPCQLDNDCMKWNRDERCCLLFGSKNCIKAVPKPLQEQEHAPIFGLIPRKCPQRPLAELWWDLRICEKDSDCWPRLCCPDGRRQYCRSAVPEYNVVPPTIRRPLIYLSEYLECTPPPPLIFDVHPKQCETTFDCFPNVCCQEAGRKHCRPPKKSLLTFMANFLNTGLLKRLTTNLVIK